MGSGQGKQPAFGRPGATSQSCTHEGQWGGTDTLLCPVLLCLVFQVKHFKQEIVVVSFFYSFILLVKNELKARQKCTRRTNSELGRRPKLEAMVTH